MTSCSFKPSLKEEELPEDFFQNLANGDLVAITKPDDTRIIDNTRVFRVNQFELPEQHYVHWIVHLVFQDQRQIHWDVSGLTTMKLGNYWIITELLLEGFYILNVLGHILNFCLHMILKWEF